MQRSIPDYRPIVSILLVIGLFFYESITSLFTYITPLSGFIFLYLIENIEKKDKSLINLILFIYLAYFELDRGFFLFSSVILFFLYYNLFHKELSSSAMCHNCLRITYIFIYYIGFYILNLFAALIFNHELPKFDITYIIYIISDTILVLL